MVAWSVRVDTEGTDYGEALDLAVRERLAPYSPAVAAGHVAGQAATGRVSVQLAVEAGTLHQAQEEARRAVLEALREHGRAQIVRLEVMSWAEFEIELEHTPPELMGVQEIAATLGNMTRQRAHQIVKREDFPSPIGHLAAGAVWAGAEVRRWAATWERKAGRPAGSRSA